MTFYTLLLINLDFIFEKEVSKTLPNKFKYQLAYYQKKNQLAKDLDHEVAFSQALLGIG